MQNAWFSKKYDIDWEKNEYSRYPAQRITHNFRFNLNRTISQKEADSGSVLISSMVP